MIRFTNEEERQNHPEARLIPEYLWKEWDLFHGEIDEIFLPLLTKLSDQALLQYLEILLNSIQFDNLADYQIQKNKFIAFICIIFGHKELTPELFNTVAVILQLTDLQLFHLLAQTGQLEYLRRFVNQLSPEHLHAIFNERWFAGFTLAAKNGHVNVMEYLEQLFSALHREDLLKAQAESAYWLAAERGHCQAMIRIEYKFPNHIQYLINQGNYIAYRKASEEGKMVVMRHLEEKTDDLPAMISQQGLFASYLCAAGKGHLDVLVHHEELMPDFIHDMVQQNHYEPFVKAAENGHLHVIKHFEELLPKQIQQMAEASYFLAHRVAKSHGHPAICHHLFRINYRCLDWAEAYWEDDDRRIVTQFITNYLEELKLRAQACPRSACFDVQNIEEAKLCFVIARCLIHRLPNTNDELQFLLNIPSVRAIAHVNITQWTNEPRHEQENELLRLALNTGHTFATEALLKIPFVKYFADRNKYYGKQIDYSNFQFFKQYGEEHESGEQRLLAKM
jgi:hypothetical protein